MKQLIEGKVIGNESVGGGWARLKVGAPEIAACAQPGQFVQVKAWDGARPLLRRPFSIAGVEDDGTILLLIKKCGPATGILVELNEGADISVLGPLGRPFTKSAGSEGNLYLVAGGVGIAPLRFYSQKIADSSKARLFFGSRDASETDILNDSLLRKLRIELTTEDGSAGEKGLVTDALRKAVSEGRPSRILTCGPKPMMAAVARIAREAGVPCEVSLETYMGCGIGVCMGCVVPAARETGKEYFHACVDGPVMDAALVDWEKL